MNTEKLISNLEDLTKQYRLLLELVRKEKQILIDANTDQINEINFQKENLLTKINELNNFRIDYVVEVANGLSIPAGEARLLNLARHIGGAPGDRLRSQHAALEIILNRIRELNEENSVYAEAALKNVSFAIDSLKETYMGQKTYRNTGKYKSGSEKSGHLVSKEA